MPIFHGNDVEVGADVIFGIEELRQLADGEAITHGQRKVSDEAGLVAIEHGSFNNGAAERVGAVENVKSDFALGGFFHAVSHGGGVSVEAHAGVLNIENERVDALKH